MSVGSMPAPELAPSPPRLRLPTTLSFDVFTTVRMLEVSPQIHSCEPSGVRASVSGPPASEIVLVTVSVLVLITETWLELGSATYKVAPVADRASPHGS